MGKDIFFFDFDGTICPLDSLDVFLDNISDKDVRIKLELQWSDGQIGSKECISKQISSAKPSLVSETVSHTLSLLPPPDKTIYGFLEKLKQKNIYCVVVSDGIDLIIREYLIKYNIMHYFSEINANNIEQIDNKIVFTQNNSKWNKCSHTVECALCKKSCIEYYISQYKPNSTYYIGDGRSDVYGAEQCDTVFAKKSLLSALVLKNKEILYPYINFSDCTPIFQ